MYLKSGSFSILDFHLLPLSMTEQVLIFVAFLLAFAVKVPMWPVHTWLPDAHVEAPTGGSVILAAIMLKIGGYGFLRFSLPITPDASHALDWLIIGMSLIAIVYIGFVALVQQDMKKLIAYSSISHMGFVTLGLFIAFGIYRNTGGVSGAALGVEGAMVQMVSHGFISGALFLTVGVLYDRVHSRMIKDYGGVANTMPWFALFAFCLVLEDISSIEADVSSMVAACSDEASACDWLEDEICSEANATCLEPSLRPSIMRFNSIVTPRTVITRGTPILSNKSRQKIAIPQRILSKVP